MCNLVFSMLWLGSYVRVKFVAPNVIGLLLLFRILGSVMQKSAQGASLQDLIC